MLKYLANRRTITIAWIMIVLVSIVCLLLVTQPTFVFGPCLLFMILHHWRKNEKENIRKIILSQVMRLQRLAIEERFSKKSQAARSEFAGNAIKESIATIERRGIVVTQEIRQAFRQAIGLN